MAVDPVLVAMLAQTEPESVGPSSTGLFAFMVVGGVFLAIIFRRAANRSRDVDDELEREMAVARATRLAPQGDGDMLSADSTPRCAGCRSVDLETVPARVEGILPPVPPSLRGGGTTPTQAHLRVCRKCGQAAWYLPDYVRRTDEPAG